MEGYCPGRDIISKKEKPEDYCFKCSMFALKGGSKGDGGEGGAGNASGAEVLTPSSVAGLLKGKPTDRSRAAQECWGDGSLR